MIPLERVLSATGGKLVQPGADEFAGAVIDGRSVTRGALFFALPGTRVDGHAYVGQAVAAGAAGAVVARGRAVAIGDVTGAAIIEVDDPAAALGALGRAHRDAHPSLRVVAVTGSNGKTTTKDLITAILIAHAGDKAVLATRGNLNNHLGVPLTLLRIAPTHRYAVIEMGMSGLGEIDYLQGLARPEVAVVTLIAGVHLEQLGSLENVVRAKAEIWNGMSQRGVAVLPCDEPRLLPYLKEVPAERRLTFGPVGLKPTVGFNPPRVDSAGRLLFELQLAPRLGGVTIDCVLPLLGVHHAGNAAAAAAAALAVGAERKAIAPGLAAALPGKHRGELVTLGGLRVVDDCYNASPTSMRAALATLAGLAPPAAGVRRIAVLGDMLELGPESEALHTELGRLAAESADELITIGAATRATAAAARPRMGADRVFHTDDTAAAAARVLEVARAGDVILVKASRGLRLERVIDVLVARLRPEVN